MGKKNIALIVAGILLLVGIFSATAGGIFGGGFVGTYIDGDGIHTSEGNDNQVSKELTSFKNVDISIHAGRIEMIKSDKNVIEYNIDSSERLSVCEVIGDTFTFKTDVKFSISLFNFQDSYVRLYYIDGTEFENVTLKTSSGSLHANDFTAKTVYAKSSSGSRNLSNVKADKIDISGSSGSAKLSNITAKDMYVKSTSGSILIEGVTSQNMITQNSSGSIKLYDANTDSMDVKASSGSILIERATCQNIIAKNSSGSIKMYDANTASMDVRNTSGSIYVQGEPRGKSNLYSTSGSVKVYSSLSRDEYGYKLSSTSGSTKVDDETFKGSTGEEKANFIDASATSGSVKVYFNSRG
ncbi:MAG: DUF4097 family beta strand repeat-containing protein [Oscillospiraceae bacterium]